MAVNVPLDDHAQRESACQPYRARLLL